MLILESDGFRVHTVDAGRLRLDGGAMFGVVPKPLWSRRIAADARNRIPLQMRCLLVETPGGRRVLVDDGLGNKEGGKFRDIYGVDNQGAGGPTRLEDSLRALGVGPGDVDVVVNTHLHFDHAGGNVLRDGTGRLRPAFPNATYVIRRGEWDVAHSENERIQASYLGHNFDPLEEAGAPIRFVREDAEVVPGVRVAHTPGHTEYHQSVLVEAGSETVCFLADLVPTRAHLRLPWIMGYDLEPLVTLEAKRSVLGRAGREGWILVFEHDPYIAWGRARPVAEGDGCGLESPVVDEDLPDAEREEGRPPE